MVKIKCNQCGGEYEQGQSYEKARMKHINSKRQKYLEDRYDKNPKFWDKVYERNVKKAKELGYIK